MTRNASRSNAGQANRLTLMDRHGDLISQPSGEDETSAEYVASTYDAAAQDQPATGGTLRGHRGQLVAYTAVSLGCAAAAVAAGSYAFWLSRSAVAGDALVSVHDLLETCRDRVTRMEEELAALPARS